MSSSVTCLLRLNREMVEWFDNNTRSWRRSSDSSVITSPFGGVRDGDVAGVALGPRPWDMPNQQPDNRYLAVGLSGPPAEAAIL